MKAKRDAKSAENYCKHFSNNLGAPMELASRLIR